MLFIIFICLFDKQFILHQFYFKYLNVYYVIQIHNKDIIINIKINNAIYSKRFIRRNIRI
jgi:hypothetical protein